MKTIVINMFAGPGAGKSTSAAHVFALLKEAGVNAELATEYAKDMVWQESFKVLEDQIYIFGKQQHRIARLNDKVEVVVTDSPIFNSIIYGKDLSDTFKALVIETQAEYDNMNYFISRVKPYNPKGRMQNEDEARELDTYIFDKLNECGIKYTIVPGSAKGVQEIVNDVIGRLRSH